MPIALAGVKTPPRFTGDLSSSSSYTTCKTNLTPVQCISAAITYASVVHNQHLMICVYSWRQSDRGYTAVCAVPVLCLLHEEQQEQARFTLSYLPCVASPTAWMRKLA